MLSVVLRMAAALYEHRESSEPLTDTVFVASRFEGEILTRSGGRAHESRPHAAHAATSRAGEERSTATWARSSTFADVVAVPASIDSMSGREGFGADRELSGISFRITMRETPGIKVEADWRGVDIDSGAVYDFATILPSHDRAVLVVLASSGTAQP